METPPPPRQSVPTTTYTETEGTEVGGLHRPNTVAFHVILRTILARLPDRPGLKILDVGGDAGTYSFALAERGHYITLVDTSAHLLALAEARAASASASASASPAPTRIRILQGDATRLSNHPDLADEYGTFDAVLLLGPLWRVASADLREAALHDAWGFVCSRGGVLFCAWVSHLAHYRALALADPSGPGELTTRCGHARHYELPENMPGILRDVTGAEDVEMVGAEGMLVGGLDEMVNELEGEEFEAWVQKCLEIGTDEHGWRMADHIVGIAMKLEA